MPFLGPVPGRRTIEALFCIGAAILAGFLLRGAPRSVSGPVIEQDDTLAFDDTGIPLRLAALGSTRPHAAG